MLAGLRTKSVIILFLTAATIFFVASYFILKFARVPFFWIALLMALGSFSGFFRVSKIWLRVFFTNFSLLCLLFALVEWSLGSHFEKTLNSIPISQAVVTKNQRTVTPEFIVPHPVLGYLGKPLTQSNVVRKVSDTIIYNIKTTINEYGFRINAYDRHPTQKTFLFLGGSFTFGDGVNDFETYPSVFQKQDPKKIFSLNLAFNGFGPHHMLKIFESNLERGPLQGEKPEKVFYLALMDHVNRASGLSSWDASGPRYEIDKSGNLKSRMESFQYLNAKFRAILKKSKLYHKVRHIFYDRIMAGISDSDRMKLFLAILKQTKKIIKQRYQAEFIVIVWQNEAKSFSEFVERLKNEGFQILTTESFFPENFDWRIPHDGHPNAKSHQYLGETLYKKFANPSK